MPTINISVTVSDLDLHDGWNDDAHEFALSVAAALYEVQGDDGGAYRPVVKLPGGEVLS
jgi:hypothetical protein